jgi:hypothetical protein
MNKKKYLLEVYRPFQSIVVSQSLRLHISASTIRITAVLLFCGHFGTYEMVSVFKVKNGEVWEWCCLRTMRRWRLLIKPYKEAELKRLTVELEKRGAKPARIAWSGSTSSSSGASPSARRLSPSWAPEMGERRGPGGCA